jgi:hypothetical protein
LTRRLLSTAAALPRGNDRPRSILKTVILFIAEYDCAAKEGKRGKSLAAGLL